MTIPIPIIPTVMAVIPTMESMASATVSGTVMVTATAAMDFMEVASMEGVGDFMEEVAVMAGNVL